MSRTPIHQALALLEKNGPQHASQIAEGMGFSQRSASRHLADLHALKVVHITAWWRPASGGGYSPVYTAGAGEDVPFVKQPRKRVRRPRPVYVAKVHALGKLKQLHQPGVFNPFSTLIAQVA